MKILKPLALAALVCLLALSCKKEPVLVKTITMSESFLTMMPGDNMPLTFTCTPDNAENIDKLTIRSSDEKIAEYHDGVVYAKSGGSCAILAYCGSVSTSCRIKVYYGSFYKNQQIFGVDQASGYLYMNAEPTPQELDITLTKQGGSLYESDNLRVWVNMKYLGTTLDFTKPIDEFSLACVYANNNEDGYDVYSYSEPNGAPMIVQADWSPAPGVTLQKGLLRVESIGDYNYKIFVDFQLSNGFSFGTDWEGPVSLKKE